MAEREDGAKTGHHVSINASQREGRIHEGIPALVIWEVEIAEYTPPCEMNNQFACLQAFLFMAANASNTGMRS